MRTPPDTPAPAPTRLARGLARLALAIGVTCALAVAVEFALRPFRPGWAPVHQDRLLWRHDPLLGWANAPNHTGRLHGPEFSVDVRTNARGLRDRDFPDLPAPGRKRLLVIGDSFAWGMGVDADARFSALLAERHPQWDIINAGCSGYGTDQELLYLRRDGLALRPDVVLLLFSANDFGNNVAPAAYTYFKPYFDLVDEDLILRQVPVPPPTRAMRLERFLLGHTYVWGRLYARLGLAHGNDGGLGDFHYTGRLTFREIKEIIATTRTAGATPVLVTTPLPPVVDDLFRRFAADFNVPCVPLSQAFARTAGPLEFAHDPHWNPAGHQVAADAIDATLAAARVW
ncbi:MAG: SGNH/GDSL hydrolase family protein [Lentisphaerae bacterium]|nr:SGNH/GDSL hydrolase family protein [Lentisphaerota bacterium]